MLHKIRTYKMRIFQKIIKDTVIFLYFFIRMVSPLDMRHRVGLSNKRQKNRGERGNGMA